MRNGRGRKEQSPVTVRCTQGQTKGILKEGGGSEKRKREKGAVTVYRTGATKENFKEKGAVTVVYRTGATKENFKRKRRK